MNLQSNGKRWLCGLFVLAALSSGAMAAEVSLDGEPRPAEGEVDWVEIDFSLGSRFFRLPNRTTGASAGGSALSHWSSDLTGWGPAAEFGIRRGISAARLPLFFEAKGFIAGASLQDQHVHQPMGVGSFAVAGLTTGGALVDVSASASAVGSSATSAIRGVSSSGDFGSIDSTVSTISGFSANASTTFLDEGVLSSIVLVDGRGSPSASALGVAFTDRGLAIAASGDLSRFTILERQESEVVYAGGELRLGLSDLTRGGLEISPFAGLAGRAYLEDAWSATTVQFSPPASPGGAPPLPGQSATIELDERLTGGYYGISVGADARLPLTEQLTLRSGITASAFYLDARYRGAQLGTLSSDFTSGPVSYSAPTIEEHEFRAAGAIGLELGLGYQIGSGEISLTGTLDYLSAVPTTARGGFAASASSDGSTASAGSLAPSTREGRLAFEDLTSFGLRLGYTARF